MKVKAGEWRTLPILEKADMLIRASNYNQIGYLLRQKNKSKGGDLGLIKKDFLTK